MADEVLTLDEILKRVQGIRECLERSAPVPDATEVAILLESIKQVHERTKQLRKLV